MSDSSLEKAIVSALVYHDLLDYPLTSLEILKYLDRTFLDLENPPSLFQIQTLLEKSPLLKNILDQKKGFYFVKGRDKIVNLRINRQKLADQKWKKIRRIAKLLQILPYLRMIGVTGSLTLNNTRQESDLDLLIVTKPGRIWTSRVLVTGLIGVLGQRRRDQITKDKICLNCYISEAALEIKPKMKSHDLHAAYEYFRLIPLLEIKKGLSQNFQKANTWIKKYFFFDYDKKNNLKTVKINKLLGLFRYGFERLLDTRIGDFLEKKLGQWQKRRIKKKLKTPQPDDQVVFNDQCLMFHPHSKAPRLLKAYKLKMTCLNLLSKIKTGHLDAKNPY
jgi:predicted nucleotidyltransferase